MRDKRGKSAKSPLITMNWIRLAVKAGEFAGSYLLPDPRELFRCNFVRTKRAKRTKSVRRATML
jgi:hypothetical protein